MAESYIKLILYLLILQNLRYVVNTIKEGSNTRNKSVLQVSTLSWLYQKLRI